jgi:outer membrane protein OmpA-like peptidoglycan-associated protein
MINVRKKHIKLLFPCVIGGLLASCSNSKVISHTNTSFTEKDEVVIAANSGYTRTSIVGYGGTLAVKEKQTLFQKKIAETGKKLNKIKGIQIRTVQSENKNEFTAVVENDILFEHDSFEITEEASTILLELITIIQEMPNTQVQVIGYTDNTGTVDYNLKLSNYRAGTVANFLREHGVNDVTEFGKGVENPVASNSSEEGKRKNRRVEIHLSTLLL